MTTRRGKKCRSCGEPITAHGRNGVLKAACGCGTTSIFSSHDRRQVKVTFDKRAPWFERVVGGVDPGSFSEGYEEGPDFGELVDERRVL